MNKIKCIKYPKIGQVSNVVSSIIREANFVGLDENGDAIYEDSRRKPTLEFFSTVKLHGTNAGISYTNKLGLYTQSRREAFKLDELNTHQGFTFFVKSNEEVFNNIIHKIQSIYNINLDENVITLYGEWVGCFSYDTPILLSDGSTRNIGQIVKNKESLDVLSYNEITNKLEPKKIINWFNSGKTNDWLKIGYKRRGRGGKKPYLKVTPNHNIFKKVKSKIVEVSASDLRVGDVVFTNGNTVSTNQLDFIKGSLMGDASISDIRHFQVSHSEDNQPYYNSFIKELFKNISSDTKRISGHGSNMRGVFSTSLNEVEDIYYETYLQGNKKPNISFLNKLNPKSLAVWYMDDGTLSNHNGENRQNQAELMTMGWDLDTNEIICEWLKSRGYDNYICKDNSYEEIKYFIRFTPKGTIRFLSDISFYMLKEFDYKLPSYLHKKNKFDWFETYGEYEEGLVETKIESIEKYTPIEEYKKVKYDIEVEDNHNYFANKLLVHNSGIQKGVAISKIDKSLFIFSHFKVSPFDENLNSYWLPTFIDGKPIRDNDNNIFNILNYQIDIINIDFNKAYLSQKELGDLTQEIEDECPVAKSFGHSGIGEGNIWICNYLKLSKDIIEKNDILNSLLSDIIKDDKLYHFSFNLNKLKCIDINYEELIYSPETTLELMKQSSQLTMKVKGEKHSVTKVKTLASVDVEKMNSIHDFVEYTVTENRVQQGIDELFNSPYEYDRSKTGDFLRWIVNDIMSEEMDTMTENNLKPKDVNKYISHKAREMFFNIIDKIK